MSCWLPLYADACYVLSCQWGIKHKSTVDFKKDHNPKHAESQTYISPYVTTITYIFYETTANILTLNLCYYFIHGFRPVLYISLVHSPAVMIKASGILVYRCYYLQKWSLWPFWLWHYGDYDFWWSDWKNLYYLFMHLFSSTGLLHNSFQ